MALSLLSYIRSPLRMFPDLPYARNEFCTEIFYTKIVLLQFLFCSLAGRRYFLKFVSIFLNSAKLFQFFQLFPYNVVYIRLCCLVASLEALKSW